MSVPQIKELWPITYYLAWGLGLFCCIVLSIKAFLVTTLVVIPVMRLWALMLGGHAAYSTESVARCCVPSLDGRWHVFVPHCGLLIAILTSFAASRSLGGLTASDETRSRVGLCGGSFSKQRSCPCLA